MIVSTTITGDYTVVPNSLLNSQSIEPIAKIIYAYLRSKGARWNVFNNNLAKSIGISVNTLKRYIQQLIESGWLTRSPRRNPTNGKLLGGYDYILHNTPHKNQEAKSVDKLEGNFQSPQEQANFLDTAQPDRQNLTPNINQNKSNIEKITNVSQHQFAVGNYSELEIKAAKQYTASRSEVRNTEAYTRSVLRNNWHLPILNELLDSERKQRYKIFDSHIGNQVYLRLVKQIKKSSLNRELIAQQILIPSRVILGSHRKWLAPNYLGFLYWLYMNHYDICKFNPEDPEHIYIQFFNQLNSEKVSAYE